MKSVLISTRPKLVEKICHKIGEDETGKAIYEKRIEVRKTAPQEVPFKCYIYETKGQYVKFTHGAHTKYGYGRGKVIGEFICDKVYSIKNRGSSFSVADEEQSVTNEIARQSCLYYDDMVSYFGNKDGYGWHISNLKIYDKPRELSEFYKPCPDEYQYCQGCKHGLVTLSDDEVEYALYHGGHYDYFETVCCNKVTRPPLSWCYVEDLGEEE